MVLFPPILIAQSEYLMVGFHRNSLRACNKSVKQLEVALTESDNQKSAPKQRKLHKRVCKHLPMDNKPHCIHASLSFFEHVTY